MTPLLNQSATRQSVFINAALVFHLLFSFFFHALKLFFGLFSHFNCLSFLSVFTLRFNASCMALCFHHNLRRSNGKAGVRIIPVDSGMGVEEWESKYKIPDSAVLDDYLDTEQKTWEEEDRSIIYRISDTQSESKGSRFYQIVECDALSPEDMGGTKDRSHGQRPGFGSGEVRLVYKEAGSFEDESSPPEIDIIPSAKQQRQPINRDGLLYRTRLWAKTALEDTLENYAAFCEEEAAREEAARIRERIDYGSVGSDEMQFSFGSEEELDDLTFTEGDAGYEYENYYYHDTSGHGDDAVVSPVEEPSDEYVDAMGELKILINSVSEYLAVKEEEINQYESMPKPVKRKLPVIPTAAQVVEPTDGEKSEVKADVKEDSAVEQGIAGVKNAMSNIFSTITGAKAATGEVETTKTPSPQPPHEESGISKLLNLIPKSNAGAKEPSSTTAADPPPSHASPQPESGISKLLSFIPKSSGTSPPVAVVPPASQEPSTEKKFSIQSLLPFQSAEVIQQTETNQVPHSGAEGSRTTGNQPTSAFESVLGRLSPMRLFSSAPPSRETSPQPAEQGRASVTGESQEASVGMPTNLSGECSQSEQRVSSETRLDSGSGSVELLSDIGSGSVELLPETESSGELPEIQQRRPSPLSEPKPESGSEETGFFSPFKKSLSSLISGAPPENPTQTDNKTQDESFLGGKVKIPFFSSENISATPKAEGGMLSGILKFASGETSSVPQSDSCSSPARTPSPSRAALLESVPKANTETGWFSNLFKVPLNEPVKPPVTPTVILTEPNHSNEPREELCSGVTESTEPRTESSQKQQSDNNLHITSDVQPKSDDSKDQCPSKLDEKAKPQAQGILSGLLKLGSVDAPSPEKKPQGGNSQPQQGGIFSGLFLSASQSSQMQQTSGAQQSGGLLSGFLKLGADSGSASTDNSTPIGKNPGQQASQPAAPQTPMGGLLSGLLKKAADTVTGPQPSQPTPELQQDAADDNMKTTEALSNVRQRNSSSVVSLSDKDQSGLEVKQPADSDKPLKQLDPGPVQDQPKAATDSPQSSGLFSGLMKLTEAVSQAPKEPQATQPPLPTQPQSGNVLSGFLNKIVDSNPSQPQRPSEPGAPVTNQNQSHAAAPQQGGFLSGLFGIGTDSPSASTGPASQNQQKSGSSGPQPSQPTGNRQNLQRQRHIPPQQPSNAAGGMFSGLLNKIADAGNPQPAMGSQPEQQPADKTRVQQPPNQQGGFLSGLFSGNSTPPVTHPAPQQPQQATRQPLRRQNQIPPQSATPQPEPQQQGGLLSGLFNKLTSTDSPPQQSTPQTSVQPQNKSDGVGPREESSQSNQQGGFLSGLFGQTSPQPIQTQSGKVASPQHTTNKQPNQSGGLFSGIMKLASGENAPQELQQHLPGTSKPSMNSGQTPEQSESGGILSGLMNKISASIDQPPTSDPAAQQQHQPRAGQGRPQIQRTKPVEVHSGCDSVTEKDGKDSTQKSFLSGLFNVKDEVSSKTSQAPAPQPEKEEPKTSESGTSPSLLSSLFKTGASDSSASTPGKETQKGVLDGLLPKSKEDTVSSTSSATTVVNVREALQAQALQETTISPTQRYLEEIERLLYGTEHEYGYKDLLYNFTEHGVIPPELYEHQCLIEALLWHQLNDYALAEALAHQVQERPKTCQGFVPPTARERELETHLRLNPIEMDISDFHIPSHPWKDAAKDLFESRNRFLEPNEDLVLFDMSCRDKKHWSSCDYLDDLDRNKKPWIVRGTPLNLSMEKPKMRLSRCQSLTECSTQEFSKIVNRSGAGSDLTVEGFNLKSATEFLKQLSKKMGPMDLTRGAMDLSSSAGATGDEDDLMACQDAEWYQQWLSLLEQGLWWPAEVGDCGYYIYIDQEYIYSLLTDRAGRHLYSCAAPEDVQALGNITENVANILKHKERDKLTLCGFKIPLCSEDFWVPGEGHDHSAPLQAPMNLTSALHKGEKIMNMNFDSFSQMFQESMSSPDHPVDFSVYKLKKIKVESVKSNYCCQEEPIEASDLTLKSLKEGHGGPYWKNQQLTDVHTSPSTSLSNGRSVQMSSTRRHPIPEIRIAHVDHEPADKLTQKPTSTLSPIKGTTGINKSENLSSTRPSSVSNKSSDTTREPSASKSSGSVQMGRKLPPMPAVTQTSSVSPGTIKSSPVISTTVPSLSPQRPRLARQPSQAETNREQASKTTVTEVDVMNKIDPKQQQNSPKECRPQLHILNDNSVSSNEAHLYKQSRNFGSPIGSPSVSKVLDFSTTVTEKEAIKPGGASNTNTERSNKDDEVVDFTKYKLKRLKEKQVKDTEANGKLTDAIAVAVDLTQKNEEDVELPHLETPTMDMCTILTAPSQTKCVPLNQQKPSRAELTDPDISSERPSQKMRVSLRTSTAVTVQTNVSTTTTTTITKGETGKASKPSAPSSGRVSKISDTGIMISTTISSSTAHIYSKESTMNDNLKLSKTAPLSPVGTSPLARPVVGAQMKSQILQHQKMKQAPSMNMRTQSLCFTVSGQMQHLKETAPANSVKATLDMSTKKTNQEVPQVAVPLKDPLSDVLALTKKKAVSFEKADTISCPNESLDLSYKAKSTELQIDTTKYPDSTQVEDYSSKMVKCPDINGEILSSRIRAKMTRQESLSGQFSLSQHKVTAPTSIIIATLDMTCKSNVSLKDIIPEVKADDTHNEVIPLIKGKPSKTALKTNAGVPLIVDVPAQESHSQVKSSAPANMQQKHPDQLPPESILPQLEQSKPCVKPISTHSPHHPSVIVQRHHMSASTRPVITAALDMSPRPQQCAVEVLSEHVTSQNEVIALVNKQTEQALRGQESAGVSLVIESKPRETGFQDSIQKQKRPSFDARIAPVVHHPITSSNEQFLGQGEMRGIAQSSLRSSLSTAPANSVKGTIDMSTRVCKPQPELDYSDPVSLVRTRRPSLADSAGLPLIVEAHSPKDRQQAMVELEERVEQNETVAANIKNTRVDQWAFEYRRQSLSGGITETMNGQISTHQPKDGFSPSVAANDDLYQRGKPVNFSSKDSLDTVNIPFTKSEHVDGQPMDFTHDKAKKEWCERKLTRNESITKPLQGIVDLSVDQIKSAVTELQDATDLTSPNVSSLSLCSRNTLQNSEPGVPYRMLPGTVVNPTKSTGSFLVSGQKIQSPQDMLKGESASPLNTKNQPHIGYPESKMPVQLPQGSFVQHRCKPPVVETGTSSFSDKCQPNALKLQRQSTNVQDTNVKPKILVKQPSVDSYGSTEEALFDNEEMAKNDHVPPPTSTWQLHDEFRAVSSPQSQPLSTVEQPHRADPSLTSFGTQPVHSNANGHSQQPKQPDSYAAPVIYQQCRAPTLHQNSVPSNQFSSALRHAPTSQSSAIHAQMPATQTFGAKVQGPEVLTTSADTTSVKGLVSLFSGLSAHPPGMTKPVAMTTQDTQNVRTEMKAEVAALEHTTVPPQTPVASSSLEHCEKIYVPATPIVENDDLCQEIPVEPSSVACISASVSNQEDASSSQTCVSAPSIDDPVGLAPGPSSVTDTHKEQRPFPAGISYSGTPQQGYHSPNISQDSQQPQSTLNESLKQATSGNEFPPPESFSKSPVTVTLAAAKNSSVAPNEKTLDVMSQTCMSQLHRVEEGKQVTSPEILAASTKIEMAPPRSMYISINSSEKPPLDPNEPQPFIRLPHIFVTAASSPEEETVDHKFDKPEDPNISTLQDNNEIIVTSDCKNSLPSGTVAQSTITSDAGEIETIKTGVLNISEEVKIDSTKMAVSVTADRKDEADSEHTTNKICPTTIDEITEDSSEQTTELDSNVNKDIISELAFPDVSEPPTEPVHENKTADAILPGQAQSLDELKTELNGKIPDGIKDPKDALSESDSSVMEPSTETTKSSLEKSSVDQVNQPENEHSEEQPGRGLFSMLGGSSAKTEQASPQVGLSILGGIIPGSSAKATSGTGFLSMFGSNVSSSPTSKEQPPPPTPREPLETQSKGKFSLFGGSNFGGDSTNDTVRPRGLPTKEPPGKGLFSMFSAGTSGPQQQNTSKVQSGGGATPKVPSSGSSIFGTILPSSTSQKETPGVGLFSKLGSLSAQPQSGPVATSPGSKGPPTPKDQEPTVKSVFSMFGRQNQQPSEAQPTPSKAPESDNVFKGASVFSLVGGTDSNKGKTAFSLFGLGLKDETMKEPETAVPVKKVIVSGQSEKPLETTDVSAVTVAHGNEFTGTKLPGPSSSVEGECQIDQSCTDSKLQNDKTNEISSQDSHRGSEARVAAEPDLTFNENDSIEISATESASVTVIAPEKEQVAGREQEDATVKVEEHSDLQPQSKITEEDACKEDAISKPETLEIQRADDVTETAVTQSAVEKMDSTPGSQVVFDVTDNDKSPEPFVVEEVTTVAEEHERSLEGQQNKDVLNVLNEEQTEVLATSNKEPQGQAEGGDVEKLTESPSEVVGDKQGSITDTKKPEDSTLESSAGEEKPSTETGLDAVTAVSESEQITDVEVKTSAVKPAIEPPEPKVEQEGASTESDCGLMRPESNSDVPISDEKRSVDPESEKIPTIPGSLKGLPSEPALHQPQQQPMQGRARPPQPGQRMAGPGFGGPQMRVPRMPGPRMPGPRHPGPQKPPEPAPFSGFMSMFSTPNVSNRQPSMGGFFSSSPGSIFGSSSTPRSQHQQQQKQQQKSSFFGLPSNIATESITTDLFGIFKGSETTKYEEHQQSESEKSTQLGKPFEDSEKTEKDNTPSPPQGDVQIIQDPGVPEKGLIEKAEKTDKIEEDKASLTKSPSETQAEPEDRTHTDNISMPCSSVPDKDPPQAHETKGIFELPSLTAPKFGFMSAATEGTPSIGSLFSAIPSSSAVKSSHPEQADSGFFSGFKNLSASILQDEKPSGKDEQSAPSSMFGMKLGSIFGNNEPPKAESPPAAVTVQPQAENTEESCEPESEKRSPGSGGTESADVSDTEGPTETSKTGSCDTLAQSPQSGLPSLSGSLAEALDKPQPKVVSCDIAEKTENTTDTTYAEVRDHPRDLLKQEATKRLVQFV